MFHNVTIVVDKEDKTISNFLTFKGNYAPVSIGEGGDNTLLYIGTQNTLYYPNAAMNINAFRAYFQLDGIKVGDPTNPQSGNVRQFVINFGEESTAVTTPLHDRKGQVDGASWFTLDGRRLSGKPTTKGIYLSGGRKVVVK